MENTSRFPPLDQTLRIHLERNEAYSRKGIETSCNIFLSDDSRIASRSWLGSICPRRDFREVTKISGRIMYPFEKGEKRIAHNKFPA